MAREYLVTEPRLTQSSLRRLFDEEILAIRVPDYIEFDVARKLASWLLNGGRIEQYTHEEFVDGQAKYTYYGVDRVGFPFNQVIGDREKYRSAYQPEALPAIRRLRNVCAPHVSPIDKLRLELDEIWPQGCNLANFYDGTKMFAGLGRIMRPEFSHQSEEKPHCDSLPKDVFPFDGRFSANIYLSVPSMGGELEIWDVQGNEQLTRADLGAPTVVIKPLLSDLLLFNTIRMHAIRSFQDSARVSIQCFIGYKQGQPPQLWN